MAASPLRKRFFIAAAVAVTVLVTAGTTFAISTWGEVNRVTIDRPEQASPAPVAAPASPDGGEGDSEHDDGSGPAVVSPSEGLDVLLLVGSDSRDELESLDGFGAFGGNRADVVMVLLRTESEAAVMSIPRDLLVEDLCGGGEAKINRMLEGCGDDMNGPTLLTLVVEELIGQPVDHFALVDLAGFQEAVDAIGGYEICVENPVRDKKSNLELPAGCTLASGDQTLAWLRSRGTQELIDNGWRTIPGMSDLVRNERQRKFLLDMMSQLGDFSSPQAIAATAQAVAPYLTVDSELTLASAVNLAWTMRGLATGAISELEIPVYDHITEHGAFVLLPSIPVDQIVAGFVTPETAQGSPLQATN
jgi:LCP family protein required for cell wall assembly